MTLKYSKPIRTDYFKTQTTYTYSDGCKEIVLNQPMIVGRCQNRAAWNPLFKKITALPQVSDFKIWHILNKTENLDFWVAKFYVGKTSYTLDLLSKDRYSLMAGLNEIVWKVSARTILREVQKIMTESTTRTAKLLAQIVLTQVNSIEDELQTAKVIHNRQEQDQALDHISELLVDLRSELEKALD